MDVLALLKEHIAKRFAVVLFRASDEILFTATQQRAKRSFTTPFSNAKKEPFPLDAIWFFVRNIHLPTGQYIIAAQREKFSVVSVVDRRKIQQYLFSGIDLSKVSFSNLFLYDDEYEGSQSSSSSAVGSTLPSGDGSSGQSLSLSSLQGLSIDSAVHAQRDRPLALDRKTSDSANENEFVKETPFGDAESSKQRDVAAQPSHMVTKKRHALQGEFESHIAMGFRRKRSTAVSARFSDSGKDLHEASRESLYKFISDLFEKSGSDSFRNSKSVFAGDVGISRFRDFIDADRDFETCLRVSEMLPAVPGCLRTDHLSQEELATAGGFVREELSLYNTIRKREQSRAQDQAYRSTSRIERTEKVSGTWTAPTTHEPSTSVKKEKGTTFYILLPSGAKALLTLQNAVEFLQDGIFVSNSEKSSSASMLESPPVKRGAIPIQRQLKDGRSVTFYLFDDVSKFRHWRELVCVFVTGQKWQFKDWAYSNPADIFSKHLGFHLHYSEEKPDANASSWNVKLVEIPRDPSKRHAVKGKVHLFWKELEDYMEKKGL